MFQQTALHWAAVTGRTGVVELLVASGADVHLRDVFGNTALREAAARPRTEDGSAACHRPLVSE
jgi:ankyrin repeat protein